MKDINLIDSHCHLIFENFNNDLEEVALRWRSKGVKKLLHACCDLSEIPKLQKIANKFSDIFYSVGLHPLDANKWRKDSQSILRKAIQNDNRVVAIGELGLDLFKCDNKEIQLLALHPQLELAYELDLPVIVHCRDAAEEMITLFKDLSRNKSCPRGVLHCWSGSPREMHEFLEMGFYISFSGIVTFPKAYKTHDCARLVPSNRYLVETDSPFLAPVPHRGKRNEPAYVESVAQAIASIRSMELITVAKETSENAEKLFKFDLVK
ncbi:MAG: deoxyribonuclease [Prochlorococcus sp. SP3034]|nr:deoxyribonuclease [Prochlorococcus sp. SP3034]|tara:strand:+ start:4030 stop:4824 length:795 start_codon:yes stop_codon:yes gene_type:complete